MPLSNDLISQFVKSTRDNTKTKSETTVYGTVQAYDGEHKDDSTIYVQLDNTDEDLYTPVKASSVYIDPKNITIGERVMVLIKNHTATITGSVSHPSAKNEDLLNKADKETLDAESLRIGKLEADYITVNNTLIANEGKFSKLEADKLDANEAAITYATIKSLEATNAKIENLDATYASIESLDAVNAKINNLGATYATIESLDATDARIDNLGAIYATITDLNAAKADISVLTGDVADINTLMFGSATGSTIQTSFANSVVAQIGNAQIKSAMIQSISASKITSGDIVTNNVRVKSQNGLLLISDETIQISDSSRVRVQIGKDASNDYSINIWDENGNLMFSEGGITDSAIKEAIIRNDMVSDTANIAAHKLDIDSLFDEINGSINTIKSTKVYLDDKKQTLDLAFTLLSTTVSDLQNGVSSQGTQISAIQGQITSKIWQSDINTAKNELEEQTETLSTKYSTLEQRVDGLSTTVSSNSTAISKKADNTTVTNVTNRVSTLETSLSGFKSTVSDTYATKTALKDATDAVSDLESRVDTAETSISQNSKAIDLRATKTEVSTAKSEAISSANTNTSNLLKNYSTTTQMNSAISAKADSITSTVSSTYATKSALNTTNSNVTSLGTRMTSAETSITQLSNKITANVTETTNLGTRMSTVEQTASGLTTRLNNQTIGGTNILRGTNTMTELTSTSPWPSGAWRKAGGGTGERTIISITDAPNADIAKGFKIVGQSDDAVISQDGVPVVEGVEYTISCYARGTGNLVIRIGRSPYDTGYYALSDQTTWKRYSFSVVVGLGSSGNGNALVNGKTNIYFGNNGTGTMEICGFKMEIGNVATDWTPSPYDFDSGIEAASKTATNYLGFSSGGLVVGDMTASTLGNNVLIDSDSVDIRKNTTTLASFGANYLYLAKNSRNATIDLCNGLAKLYHQSRLSYDTLFVIETPNATEIRGTSDPLCVTSTVASKPAIKFANSDGVLGSIGMVASGTESYITRNHPSTSTTYSILDTGNFYKIMDSGWINCSLNTGSFTRYNNDIPQPQVRKIGKQVYLRGEAKPVVAVTPESDSDTVIATIPSGYRPAQRKQFIMQGSGSYRWLMSIHTDGRIAISRYSNTTTGNMNIAAGAWLCCHAQWLID